MNTFTTVVLPFLFFLMINMLVAAVWMIVWSTFEETELGQMFLEWLKKKMKRKKEHD